MASSRIKYDKCTTKLSVERSTDPGNYRLFRPFAENCNTCYSNNGPKGSIKDSSEVRKTCSEGFGELIDLESEIVNRVLPLNECNSKECNRGYLEKKSKLIHQKDCNKKMEIEDTRFTNPITNYREMSLTNYFYNPHLPINPQNHIQRTGDRNGISTRHLAKDQYRIPKQDMWDQTPILPPRKNLKIQNDLSYSSDSESDKSRPSSPSDSPMNNKNNKDFCDTCNKK